jgi:putative ABC transport system permease protein
LHPVEAAGVQREPEFFSCPFARRSDQLAKRLSTRLGAFSRQRRTPQAALGICGLMAYVVDQGTREIGIRMALGLSVADVLRLMAGQAVWLIVGGLPLGLAGALALTRYLSSELWEVQATDPATFLGVTVLLVAVAVLACIIPTRRGEKVDPTEFSSNERTAHPTRPE